MPYWAVIPATGVGQRMQADRPKQYLSIQGKTILEHTLDKLLGHPAISGAVLILQQRDDYWPGLNYRHDKPLLIAHGGEQRHHSVYNGLQVLQQYLQQDCYVLIHDAVRPFVRRRDLDALIEAVQEGDDGALLAAPVADTLKLVDQSQRVNQTASREGLWRAFTPQAFRLELITQALGQVVSNAEMITDDASAMELAGFHPKIVEGDSLNFKITHPNDLAIAKWLLQRD
ncbi:MAG: 2-C-methyl-D-erythritol 4-phosphate cytidylyltransferase [Gammaproteobacteria bacterium]|nr:2-C-methyl-D-erythritol 4-phosphate cytidylyltransferase [Gammaproteobacteria bacterium]